MSFSSQRTAAFGFLHSMGECSSEGSLRAELLTSYRGGVRGAVELEILKQIVKELGGAVNIQSFFDLIVGTR